MRFSKIKSIRWRGEARRDEAKRYSGVAENYEPGRRLSHAPNGSEKISKEKPMVMAVSDTPATELLNAARGMKLRSAKMRGIAISSKSAVHVAANRPVAHDVRQLPVAAYSG